MMNPENQHFFRYA